MAHWSIEDGLPAIVSMPTGSGKTAVAVALPYLAKSHRVLVIVPSRELRRQVVSAFRSRSLLQDIGVLEGEHSPDVHELKGRPSDWSVLDSADVVVSIPASISPSHFEEDVRPPRDLFDLIIMDEAHHAPAATWASLLHYFSASKKILLTATPYRRDDKPLPGKHIFHFPLSKAITDGIYKPIEARVLEVDSEESAAHDKRIALEVLEVASSAVHASSSILVRASSIERAQSLKTLYGELGMDAELVHSKAKDAEVRDILSAWRAGSLRAVIAVDMLGEGIDLPSLRVVAYHDKHKSSQATIQLIGRLARVHEKFPQPSVLITTQASEALSAVETTLRALYEEDAQWIDLLPRLVDEPVLVDRSRREYIKAFTPSPPEVNLESILPPARAVVFEAPMAGSYQPCFVDGGIPAEVQMGAVIAGSRVIYSGLNEAATMLVVLTAKQASPRWYVGRLGLEAPVYDLHLFNWHRSDNTDFSDLLLENSGDRRISAAIRDVLDPNHVLRKGDPASLQGAFDANDRLSVSSVGVRNTYAGTSGAPSYAMFAGTDVERGLRDADTNSRALGHAIAQIDIVTSRTTAGFSAAKAKYWETRNLSLANYEDWVADLSDRFWSQKSDPARQLLPQVARGARTQLIPESDVLMIEMNPKLAGRGWRLPEGQPLEGLELAPTKPLSSATDLITMKLVDPRNPDVALWCGAQNTAGKIASTGQPITVSRGAGLQEDLADLLSAYPPNVYFLDGQTIHGNLTYKAPQVANALPPITYIDDWDWSGTDIRLESKRSFSGGTIHHLVETKLARAPQQGVLRWVLCNDGKGEIADHIVIELKANQRPTVELWHAKFAGTEKAGVRVGDMEVLVQQAIKNRRHLVDRGFWKRLGRRLDGKEQPQLHLVSGDSITILRAICGLEPHHESWSIADRPPVVEGKIVLVQPGLSLSELDKKLKTATGSPFPGHVREFLTVLHNSVQGLAKVELVASK